MKKKSLILFFLIFLCTIAGAQSLRNIPTVFRDRLLVADFQLKGNVQCLRECTYRFDEQAQAFSKNYSTTTYWFNESGNLSSIDYATDAESGDVFTIHYHYTGTRLDSIIGGRNLYYQYSPAGRLQAIAVHKQGKGLQYTNRFTYEADKIIQQQTTEAASKRVTTSRYTYHTNGEVLTVMSQMPDDVLTYVNDFSKPGILSTTATYKKHPENNYTTVTKLNAHGDNTELLVKQKSGQTLQHYEYVYDKYGNWLRQTNTTDGKPSLMIVRKITYNTAPGHTTESTASKQMPVASTHMASPGQVLAMFFEALDKRRFAEAYKLCTGKRWGTLAYFSSAASYGGISAVEVHSIEQPFTYADEVTVNCSTTVTDKINGTGTFRQAFTLQKQPGNSWRITHIKLIESSRPTDNWNLKMPAQSDFTMADVKRLTKHVYDTLKNSWPNGDTNDEMIRTFSNLNFIKTGKEIYAVAICENQGREAGACTGWCDAFAFRKTDKGWRMTTVLLQAGGGGRMGYPGKFERIIRVGDFTAGIVISSYIGQSGIESVSETIAALKDGNLEPLVSISTAFTTDDSFGMPPGRLGNEYHFERQGKPMYDLIIDQYDETGKKPRKLRGIRIPYKNGYDIPDEFLFES
jgi:hypothetical protein